MRRRVRIIAYCAKRRPARLWGALILLCALVTPTMLTSPSGPESLPWIGCLPGIEQPHIPFSPPPLWLFVHLWTCLIALDQSRPGQQCEAEQSTVRTHSLGEMRGAGLVWGALCGAMSSGLVLGMGLCVLRTSSAASNVPDGIFWSAAVCVAMSALCCAVGQVLGSTRALAASAAYLIICAYLPSGNPALFVSTGMLTRGVPHEQVLTGIVFAAAVTMILSKLSARGDVS